ncbi:MAG: hypothetical protein K0R51_2718 [Cytophagaceae bacterium]|nr:hypothetical protein [Cytophagaceae bacterium]
MIKHPANLHLGKEETGKKETAHKVKSQIKPPIWVNTLNKNDSHRMSDELPFSMTCSQNLVI